LPCLHLKEGRTYFRLEGHPGLPVLALLHPIGADHSLWDKVVPLLLPAFQVLRPDLRGHGGSDVAPGEYSAESLAEEFVQLCEELDLHWVHLCGISLGGMVAATVAARYPSLVGKLVLCSTAARLAPPPGGWEGRAAAAIAQGMAPIAESMIQRMVSPAHLANSDPAVATYRNVLLRMDPQGFAGACAVLRDVDLSTVLPAIEADTLVLTGDGDALMPADTAATLLSHLESGKHASLPCGHFPPLEVPGAFVQQLLEWTAKSRA
jgi:3-oxoadipate enol-lactonase